MVMQGPRHAARNFMAWPSRIPEVAVRVDVVILMSREISMHGTCRNANPACKGVKHAGSIGLRERTQREWVLLRSHPAESTAGVRRFRERACAATGDSRRR